MLVKWKFSLLSINTPSILHIPGPVVTVRTTKGDNYCSCRFTNQAQTWLLDSLDRLLCLHFLHSCFPRPGVDSGGSIPVQQLTKQVFLYQVGL